LLFRFIIIFYFIYPKKRVELIGMVNVEKYKVEQVVQAVKDAHGMVSKTADILRCTPATVHNYIKRHPKVAAAVEEARERMLDTAELVLFDNVRDGEAWAVCFYLKTQGKRRGYTERQENIHTGPGGGPIHTVQEAGVDAATIVEMARILDDLGVELSPHEPSKN
jgi:hypothetical protein